jgi:hypothetical protein
LRVALRELVPVAAAVAVPGSGVPSACCSATAPGGVLLVAPGMPCGPSPAVVFSLTCSLRSFCGSALTARAPPR